MANSAKTSNTVVGTTIDALVKEGKALGKIWKQTNSLKDSTKANGFDTRLGKLMQELKAQSTLDSGQIPTHVLRTHGIANIDRRRRSEALWFVENEVACRKFMESSKKGFTSLSALQKAMNQAAKDAKASSANGTEKVEQPVAKAKVSDVGQSDKVNETNKGTYSVPITRTMMVQTIVKQCELNGLDLEQIVDDLLSQLAKAS
jgi:hypothetical protein